MDMMAEEQRVKRTLTEEAKKRKGEILKMVQWGRTPTANAETWDRAPAQPEVRKNSNTNLKLKLKNKQNRQTRPLRAPRREFPSNFNDFNFNDFNTADHRGSNEQVSQRTSEPAVSSLTVNTATEPLNRQCPV
ncbi:hypothetical protein GBF38_015895 [Nibea albiflora]|uniref:Uncharacterized protein n=1 Tax=Nibea albiflora TaxID=240163 RepID=A0ACB7FGX7_NIBAL|nr:hypothetical protein GBF38_015895 [Nibea albiflora]